MPGPIAAFPLLMAQAAPAAGAGGSGNSTLSLLTTILPLVLLFYLIVLRPQQQEARRRRQMIEAMKKNDYVLTESGIYGTVVSINPESNKVVLRVDDDKGVRLTVNRASVSRVLDSAAEKAGETA